MKKFIIITCASLMWSCIYAQNIPERRTDSYINDFANVIDDAQESVLDQKIRDFKAQSSIEMTVVSINSLDGNDVDSYSHALFQKWGIGTKELNNGILILFSVEEHKWRVEVGTGLEEYIPDGYAKVKAQELLVPNFKRKDYSAGVNLLLDNFITTLGPISWDERALLQKKKKAEAAQNAQAFSDGLSSFFMWFTIVGGLFFSIILLIRNERKKRIRLEEEAAANKKKLEKLVADNNASINEFSRMYVWFKEYQDIFNTDDAMSLVREFVIAKKKVDDLYSQRVLAIEQLESEQLLITNITKDILDKVRPMYTASIEFESIKKSIKEFDGTLTSLSTRIIGVAKLHKTMTDSYGQSVVNVAFPSVMLNSKLEQGIISLVKLSNFTGKTVSDRQQLKTEFKYIQATANEVKNHLDVVSEKLETITSSVQYVQNNRGRVTSLLHDAQRKVADNDVTSSTKSKFITAKAKAEMFRESTNPLITYDTLYALISDLNNVIKYANNDIDDAERSRRRKREEEEDSIRRAASIYASTTYSSSNDNNNYGSPNNNNDTSFGGGSSSGGGASGDW